MNYRHDFHAGNFADVLKHAVLCRILQHLRGKPAAFRVIDTHAGAGLYDLGGAEAVRSGEWRDGIARLRAAVIDDADRDLFAPYLTTIAAFNADGVLRLYPGSPAIARHWLRGQDRLIACELEPRAATALEQTLGSGKRAKVIRLDGWTALTAYVPPKERRGIVLVDPPYEEPGEFERLAERLASAYRKWPTGIYLAWYPIKTRREPDALVRSLQRLDGAAILRAEIGIATVRQDAPLSATGLVIINPPWTLHDELARMLPRLARILSSSGNFRLDRLDAAKT